MGTVDCQYDPSAPGQITLGQGGEQLVDEEPVTQGLQIGFGDFCKQAEHRVERSALPPPHVGWNGWRLPLTVASGAGAVVRYHRLQCYYD